MPWSSTPAWVEAPCAASRWPSLAPVVTGRRAPAGTVADVDAVGAKLGGVRGPGHGASGVLVPGVRVLGPRSSSHLEHSEHPAHIDVPKGPMTPSHRGAVGGDRHLHLAHAAHAGLTHAHVLGEDAAHAP